MHVSSQLHPNYVHVIGSAPQLFLSKPSFLGRNATGLRAGQSPAIAVEPAYSRINAKASAAMRAFTKRLFFGCARQGALAEQ